MLSKLHCCFWKSEVCPKTSCILENCQEIPLGWEIIWMNNKKVWLSVLCSPLPMLKSSFSDYPAISCALWVSVIAIRYPDVSKQLQRFFPFFLSKKIVCLLPSLRICMYLKFCWSNPCLFSTVCYCKLRLIQAQWEDEFCPPSLEMVKLLNFEKPKKFSIKFKNSVHFLI